jgi:hypothetical protein
MVTMKDWDWQLYPEAKLFLDGLIRSFLKVNHYADVLRGEIENTSSTRFIDWVDSLEVPADTVTGEELIRLGYAKENTIIAAGDVYIHPGAAFFPIVRRADRVHRLSLKVDDLDRALAANHLGHKKISGEKDAPLRSAELNQVDGCSICAIERHGSRSFEIRPATDIDGYRTALNVLSSRKRTFGDDMDGMEDLGNQIAMLTDSLDRTRVADAFFRAERAFWHSKNRAGQVQHARQESLGLGWGNQDHHTFRCSRENFRKTVAIFEEMGMKRRERFFAGAEAGWGAQVLEQPDSGLVVFTDVDLGPEETHNDFVDQELGPLDRLGTVGLWVGLHGESVLDSGMHHLAVRSDFKSMRDELRAREITSMNPFSDLYFLKQSFTEAERWIPSKIRMDRLVEAGHIPEERRSRLLEHGAVGSHLEIIQRDRGFRGFNQGSVSAIIRMTDPLERSGIGA